MIGSLITRGLVLIFGYAYPAYECYKMVEMNKPDIVQLRFWCQYWILVAMLTVCERISDMFIGWIPMYGEAKLAFFIYLWFPKTKGTTYVYDSFFRPYVAKHETDIDRNLVELRTRAGDMALLYFQKATSYGQTRIFDILQYIASQSSLPRPAQTQEQSIRAQMPTAPSNRKTVATTQPNEQPSSSASSISSSEDETEEDSKTAPAPVVLNEQKSTPTLAIAERTRSSVSSAEQVVHVASVPPAASQKTPSTPKETVLEEARRVTRARSRKTSAAAASIR